MKEQTCSPHKDETEALMNCLHSDTRSTPESCSLLCKAVLRLSYYGGPQEARTAKWQPAFSSSSKIIFPFSGNHLALNLFFKIIINVSDKIFASFHDTEVI